MLLYFSNQGPKLQSKFTLISGVFYSEKYYFKKMFAKNIYAHNERKRNIPFSLLIDSVVSLLDLCGLAWMVIPKGIPQQH